METTTTHPEIPKAAVPQPQHEWLHKLVGEWAYEHECVMSPGEAPSVFRGTETVRSLGGLWVVGEGTGEMPGGGTAHSMITLGYDPVTGRFVGTWIGSMMTHLWIYDGELDSAGRVLILTSEGPDCGEGGKLSPFQDRIEFVADDHRTLTSYRPDENGEWQLFMTAHYYRKK